MRKRWKEVGLGFVTLLIIALAATGSQLRISKVAPPDLGPLLVTAIVLVTYLASVRWIERRPVVEFAPRGALREMIAGLVIGFALFASVMGILWVCGVYHPAGMGTAKGIAAGLALAIMAGVFEEILFRGILFRVSSRIVGTWGALLFTASIFGLAHLANKGATFSSGVAIMLEAGILLGAAYALTGRLWLPIGLHIAWNFTEGSIFGMSVSGSSSSDSGLLRGTLSGPPILTGGAFGPESSVVAVAVCFVVAVYLLYRTVKLGRIERPAWSRQGVAGAGQIEVA
ncbi:MAG: CPBP family intramembrane glutamic endopeptidase [Candidatus Korobacteraceae bacterium]